MFLIHQTHISYLRIYGLFPISMAIRSKAYVWSSLIAGVAGSNPPEGMDVRLLCLLCVVLVTVSAMS
jgi:hypothetical protein